MTEPALLDLLREQELPQMDSAGQESSETHSMTRGPDLEVDIEVEDDDCLLDPWFMRSEAEIAEIEDDPTARIHEVRIVGYTKFCDDYVLATG